MPRIRTIKPQAFASDSLSRVSVHARWTFAGLWTYVDDQGRGRADVRLIKAHVWPMDDQIAGADVAAYLDELERERCICRYEHDGRTLLHVINWEHQKISHPAIATLPECSREQHGGSTLVLVNPPEVRQSAQVILPPDLEGKGKDREKDSATRVAIASAPESATGAVIADWVTSCAKRPPASTISRVGKHVREMLSEGIDPDDVRRGLAAWQAKGASEASLPGFVNEVMNRGPTVSRTQRETDDLFDTAGRRMGVI